MGLQDLSNRSQVGITASCILKTGLSCLILAKFDVTSISGVLKRSYTINHNYIPSSRLFSPPLDHMSLLISQVTDL